MRASHPTLLTVGRAMAEWPKDVPLLMVCLRSGRRSAAAAEELAERLRGAVAATTFDSGDGRQLHVTLSIGIATALPDDTADTILSRADAALYAAKSGGRNRVVISAR